MVLFRTIFINYATNKIKNYEEKWVSKCSLYHQDKIIETRFQTPSRRIRLLNH